MKVLVACEYSGTVRDAFRALGHDAMSADLLPTEKPGPHHQGDVLEILDNGWDLMVAHPPCTYLSRASARWLYVPGTKTLDPQRWADMYESALFFRQLWEAPIPRVAVENPRMLRAARLIIGRGRRLNPTQLIHPWEHGHGETKATGLWLRNLPELAPTHVVPERRQRVLEFSPGPDRWMDRSRTYPGIAAAMAAQWGDPAQGALFDLATWGVPSEAPTHETATATTSPTPPHHRMSRRDTPRDNPRDTPRESRPELGVTTAVTLVPEPEPGVGHHPP